MTKPRSGLPPFSLPTWTPIPVARAATVEALFEACRLIAHLSLVRFQCYRPLVVRAKLVCVILKLMRVEERFCYDSHVDVPALVVFRLMAGHIEHG